MTPQFLSEKLSQHLSSLVPEFEGHWNYLENHDEPQCDEQIADMWRWDRVQKEEDDRVDYEVFKKKLVVCPAWQVEDFLMNLTKLGWEQFSKHKNFIPTEELIGITVRYMAVNPGAVYQKIEEYLWEVLK